MTKQLTEQSCVHFLDALASREPVPGGGGAAALAGALGVALCSMAGNLTLGRKKYAAVEDDIKSVLTQGEALRSRLLSLVEEDAALFAPLAAAYAIPKDDPTRSQVLEQVTLDACAAPVHIMEVCCQAIVLLEEMLEKGSTMMVSDVGCGALCCRAALESASLNVFVNTKTLQNRETAAALEGKADDMLREYVPRAQQVADAVLRRLRKEG